MKDRTPGSMDGGRKCIERIVMPWGNLPVPPNPLHWSRFAGRTLRVGPKKFAEPGSLPSTASADLPLAGTAFRTGFVLLALRARRKQHTNALAQAVKGV